MAKIDPSKIIKSGLWLSSGFGVTKGIRFVAQIFLVRLLTPEQFGIWGMVLVVTQLTALFKDTAISGVLVQRGLKDKTLVNTVYSLGINVSIALFFLQVGLGYGAAIFFQEPLVFSLTCCVSFSLLISAGAGCHGAVLQRKMKFREVAIASACSNAVRFGGALLLAAFGYGVWAFAIAKLGSSLVKTVLRAQFSGYSFQYHPIPDRESFKQVSGFISSLVGINLAVYINTNGDNLLIGKILGTRALGFYSLAYQLAMLPMFAFAEMNRINFSVLSQKDAAGQRRYLGKMLQLCAITSAPFYGVAFVVAPWLIPLVYGSPWQPVVGLFQIILIFAYARGFMSILGTALNALNHPEINAAINWALIPISLPAFYFSIQLGGLQGIALTTALLMGLGASLWFWLATSRVAGWNPWHLVQPVALPTLATLLMAVFAMAIPLADGPVKYGVQPLVVVLGYTILVSLGSKGHIPHMLLDLSKRTLKA